MLGIGMPTPVTYIILAIMVAPAIVALGVDPLAAHLFIFFAGMMSMVTPPVGLAAYAASAIAGSDFWKTGLWAALLALPAYLLPYAFVLNNGLLLMGDWM
ncbi:TRAP transporter large permease subunit, partial [Arthrospira platensis SPKY1]|nr:TRAP transporter large permease subunit [Arthrospira platensis SPKY1]